MTKNKESSKHSPLSKPIQRPNKPIVKVSRGHNQPKNHFNIPCHIAYGPSRVLHPTMLQNGDSNVSQLE